MENPESMFISYRSPSYVEREEYNCRTLRGQKCDLKISQQCPHNNCSFKRAATFALRQQYKTLILPPSRMLSPDALLSVSDYLEYCNEIRQYLNAADIFIRFEINHDSFWTLMEEKLWSMKDRSENNFNDTYEIYLDSENMTQSEYFELGPMDNNSRKLYWRILYYLRPENYHLHEWGRYVSCFMLRCPQCGSVTILSKRALKTMMTNNLLLSCPCCGNGKFSFHYKWGPRQPAKVYYEDTEINDINPIEPDDVVDLILDQTKSAPKFFPLVCVKDEHFPKANDWSVISGNIYNSVVCSDTLVLRYHDNNGLREVLMWKK